MEIAQTLAGFFLATLGIPLGYALFRYLPDEKQMIQKTFSWLNKPYGYIILLSLAAFTYPKPIAAALLFILFLPVGVVVQKKFLRAWLFALTILALLFFVFHVFLAQ